MSRRDQHEPDHGRRHEQEQKHHEHDPVAKAIREAGQANGHGLQAIADAIKGLGAKAGAGRFSLHVTEIQVTEDTMPSATDHTPQLDLASSSVRAKLSVVDPRLANGQRVTSVTWSTDDETELPLEAAPDDTVKDAEGNEVLDPTDQLPLSIFSVFALTPLSPADGARADGTVTCSAAGMASIDKKITYGDAADGHFTLVGVEAPEV